MSETLFQLSLKEKNIIDKSKNNDLYDLITGQQGEFATIWDKDIESVDQIDELEILKHATYKGNRLVVFDAWHWHRPEPVARICKEIRYVVVFKSVASGGNTERLSYYDN